MAAKDNGITKKEDESGSVKWILTVLLTIATLFASFQAIIELPPRVLGLEKRDDAHEERMKEIETDARSNREILIRIEEQVKQLRTEFRNRNTTYHTDQ